jgi:hypothetical protein
VWIARATLKLGQVTGRQLVVCSVLAMLLLGVAAPANGDPYQIYDRARAVWRKQTYPDDIQYRITIHVSEGNKDERQHYRGETTSAGGIRVDGVSDEEVAAPHEAAGINFKVLLQLIWNQHAGGSSMTVTRDAHRKESSPDYLGVPLIAPQYSFGLVDSPQLEPALAHRTSTTQTPLPLIATVNAVDRAYDVTLVGTEPLGGFYAYHLRLRPRHEPAKYRLRELWVDAYTYDVLKLTIQGNFTGSPMNAVPWEVTFQRVDGATYIDTETADAPLAFRADRTFTTASVSFTDIKAAETKLPVLPFMDSGQILREP